MHDHSDPPRPAPPRLPPGKYALSRARGERRAPLTSLGVTAGQQGLHLFGHSSNETPAACGASSVVLRQGPAQPHADRKTSKVGNKTLSLISKAKGGPNGLPIHRRCEITAANHRRCSLKYIAVSGDCLYTGGRKITTAVLAAVKSRDRRRWGRGGLPHIGSHDFLGDWRYFGSF